VGIQAPLLVLSNLKVGLVIVKLSNESNTRDSASWKKCLVDISKEYRHVTSLLSVQTPEPDFQPWNRPLISIGPLLGNGFGKEARIAIVEMFHVFRIIDLRPFPDPGSIEVGLAGHTSFRHVCFRIHLCPQLSVRTPTDIHSLACQFGCVFPHCSLQMRTN
jgi:hypothetical protein